MLPLLIIGFIFRGAAANVLKCCYANPFDCDAPRDWCSKNEANCASCSGQIVTEQEQRLQARMEQKEKASAEKKFHEAKQTQAQHQAVQAPATRPGMSFHPPADDSALKKVFPVDLTSKQCMNLLHLSSIDSEHECESSCAQAPSCALWQWCPEGQSCTPANSCWIGPETSLDTCTDQPDSGWVSAARSSPSAAIFFDGSSGMSSGGALLSFSTVLLMGSMIGFIVRVAARRANGPSLSRPLIEVVM